MLTARFEDAMRMAFDLHAKQTRKGNGIPYISHLMAVSGRVMELGGDEDTVIAALLHDAIEDQGGPVAEKRIRERFGDRVAGLVLACTDSKSVDPAKKAPWIERKTAHIEHMRHVGFDVAMILFADKLHNARTTLTDIRIHGPETMSRFNATPDQTLWYFRQVAEAIDRFGDALPVFELREVADAIEQELRAGSRPLVA